MTLLGYFWDRWPYFAGKLSWYVTATQVNSALHPSRVAKSSTSFGWGKGGKVTAAGWQVTLCDPIWHAIFRSGVVISITNCYIRVYFTLLHRDTRCHSCNVCTEHYSTRRQLCTYWAVKENNNNKTYNNSHIYKTPQVGRLKWYWWTVAIMLSKKK